MFCIISVKTTKVQIEVSYSLSLVQLKPDAKSVGVATSIASAVFLNQEAP